MREAGIESVVEAAVQIYLEETPKRMESLQRAVDSGDLTEVESEAHGMKSGSRNIRADALGSLLETMEHSARDGKAQEIRQGLPAVKAEFQRVMAFLREYGSSQA
jgi:HPt (histidine-containing phosphotransfer) domain-containing protein